MAILSREQRLQAVEVFDAVHGTRVNE
jgi:hypothetical protein